MNTFPLIRTRGSNEHIMATLFVVLILYHLPIWAENPANIFRLVLLVATGLAVDAIANLLRYKRMWCCVSGGITAAIISLLCNGVPLEAQFLGVVVALILGKHLWGGTGNNIFNPAMVGVLIILLGWNVPYPFVNNHYLLIPAIILCITFLFIRPYAGLGFIAGAIVMLIIGRDFTLVNVLSSGLFFWACIVMTDTVTITRERWKGLVLGVIVGMVAFLYPKDIRYIVILVLSANLISYFLNTRIRNEHTIHGNLKIPKVFHYDECQFVDLTKEKPNNEVIKEEPNNEVTELDNVDLSSEELIMLLKRNEVYGMGGAAFPTDQKLAALNSYTEGDKFLIINAVECDPGLVHDDFILHKYPDELRKAIEILKENFEFKTIYLALKNNYNIKLGEDIHLHNVNNRYPAGAEKLLIREVLTIDLNKHQIPVQRGILVLNIQTIYAIYKAVFCNESDNTRFITVANRKDATAKIVKVRLGMKVHEVLESVYPGESHCFVGGGMMQAHLGDEQEVVDRRVNFITNGAFPKFKESPQCSHCGNCVSNCPASLQVNKIVKLVDQGKLHDTIKYRVDECIECACCSYSCLAGRNLSSKVKEAKLVSH